MGETRELKIQDITSAISYVVMSREKEVGDDNNFLTSFITLATATFCNRVGCRIEDDSYGTLEIEPQDVQDLIYDMLFDTMDSYAEKQLGISDGTEEVECSVDDYKQEVIYSITKVILDKWLLEYLTNELDPEIWEEHIHKFYKI